MSDPKRLPEQLQSPPSPGSPDYQVVPTGCQYCVVGCGYDAHLWHPGDGSNTPPGLEQARWVSPAMTGQVRSGGQPRIAAVTPAPTCSMNKGNHSSRGGTQGRNLVYSKERQPEPDSTRERIKTAYVRTQNGFEPIGVDDAIEVLTSLVKQATGHKRRRGKVRFGSPGGLGVKLFEYQFLENTYAATKLFFQLIGTPNVAFHDRPSVASNTQGFSDSGIDPHGYAYDDIWASDVLFLAGSNPYECQSVFFMQYMAGKKMIVLDPRRTITADYAEKTGGLHLQPRVLGADTYVLNALARYIRLKQLAAPANWPPRVPEDLVATNDQLAKAAVDAAETTPDEGPAKRRKARYQMSLSQFDEFLTAQFGGSTDPDAVLDLAASASGIPVARLQQAAQILAGPKDGVADDLPVPAERKVSLIFEKGLIWGYSYQNTAAMANLGLLLGSVLREGDEGVSTLGVTGRAGGHQKGWAEVRYRVSRQLQITDSNGRKRRHWRRWTAGYPFHNAVDEFAPKDGGGFRTHHYLDAHLVGTQVAPRHRLARGPAQPDIGLLWIVGSNSFGQIGNAQAKAEAVNLRRGAAPDGSFDPEKLPASASKSAVRRSLLKRIKDGGLVVVQQDIYPNPTTDFADLVLPAAGWGEDDFTRYTGERRLRLYGRFQDPPAYRNPSTDQLETDDQGNPKSRCLSDWRIFSRVAKGLLPEGAVGNGLPDTYEGDDLSASDFAWKTSAEVFREMSRNSNRASWLGALESGAGNQPRGHELLRNRGTEGYIIPLSIDQTEPLELHEHRRTPVAAPSENPPPGTRPYAFVKSDWTEIKTDFTGNLARNGEFFICNGRVNELWNSMFTHIRNETVRQRWPDDLPGTILEMHPEDAASMTTPDGDPVTSGSVVEVNCDDVHLGGSSDANRSFRAVVSLQADSMPRGTVFAIFSYPAMDTSQGNRGLRDDFPFRHFHTEAYANNVVTGYVDPINPIAAVKYARGRIVPTGDRYESNTYLGPSHGIRNVAFESRRLSLTATRQERLDWQMRELIVQKGLPRARLHGRRVGPALEKAFYDPDELMQRLQSGAFRSFGERLESMYWALGDRVVDDWQDPYLAFAKRWVESQGGAAPPPPSDETRAMFELIERRTGQAEWTHDFVPVGDSRSLRQLFQAGETQQILEFLKEDSYLGKKLVVGQSLEKSEFYQLLQGAMRAYFSDAERTIVANWIMSLPAPDADEPDAERAMLALLRDKQAIAEAVHGAVTTPGESLSELFRTDNFEAVLTFLRTATSQRAPFSGKRLVVPQRPQESAFFLHLTDPHGVMVGKLTTGETEVVRRWIMSLSLEPVDQPGPVEPFRLKVRRVASGLSRPVFVTAPPGDRRRLFILEQTGTIRILNLVTGQLAAQPFLRVPNLSSAGERGLLGLAFHPSYSQNGFLYINCTDAAGHTNIRRYTVSADANVADRASEQLVLKVAQPFTNHNGGWLDFGPRDGFLYVALGDGGSRNDPQNNAQNPNVLLGKMLRIDVNGDDFPGDATRNYAVPPSNPFVGHVGTRSEIWASGLRNPWRCSFDRETGDLYIGDVGQDEIEEVNFQPADSTGGENYGWRVKEGARPTGLGSISGQQLVDPIHQYDRATGGVSVIGGYVYRGPSPELRGLYLFADLNGQVWSFRKTPTGTAELTERTQDFADAESPVRPIVSMGEDAAGELYVVSHAGDVFRVGTEAAGKSRELTESQIPLVSKVRIHPAIGVARLGNSGFVDHQCTVPADPADYFVGPERPFDTAPPAGGYKRNGKVRRQAARFRVFAFDQNEELLGEVTSRLANISWRVTLANTKASWHEFAGLKTDTPLRNSQGSARAPADRRAELNIQPAPQQVSGIRQAKAIQDGTFTSWRNDVSKTLTGLYLGQIETDDAGCLLVLGGQGRAESPWGGQPGHYANNDGWFDDASDGPVTAQLKFKNGGQEFEAESSWVVCVPPKFAPALQNIVTLYDVVTQIAVDRGWSQVPTRPSFKQHIYPILERTLLLRWIMGFGALHDGKLDASFPPASQDLRNGVFRRLRDPSGNNSPSQNMPKLRGDDGQWSSGTAGLTVTKTQYAILQAWRDGTFNDSDWDGTGPVVPAEITPAGLDQAALEHCAGGGFYPGIEAGWFLRDVFDYVRGEPVRFKATYLDPVKQTEVTMQAGDVTKQMAVPWHADFYACTAYNNDGSVTNFSPGWWPQQRPDRVMPANDSQLKDWVRDKVSSNADMVARWFELGFVVAEGNQFVETDRNPNAV